MLATATRCLLMRTTKLVFAAALLAGAAFAQDNTPRNYVGTIGTVSVGNSTDTELAADASFNGAWEDVKNYASIQVILYTTHASANNGLGFSHSSINSTADIIESFTIPASSGMVFTFRPGGRYFKITYQNGSTLQGTFRLQTIYHTTPLIPSIKVGDTMANAQSAPLSVSFASVFNGTDWERHRASVNALNSTGIGLATAQIIGQFDDASPTAITENQFGNLRMSANRNLFGTIRDAAGNERGANVSAGNALLVDGSAATQPVSGTFWQATQPMSAASLPLPTGASTLAEQQTQTTALQLIDDAVATTAAAIPTKGVAASGTDGTNARVLKTDTSGELQVDVLTVPSITIGTFPDNEPFNVAQINGVTPLMGAGNTGTGSQRVTLATDNAAIPTWGHGALGAAPSANATQISGPTSGATGGLSAAVPVCTEFFNINQTAGTQLITGVSGRRVYICSFNVVAAAAQNIALVAGTGTVCATSTVAVPGTSGGTTAATGWNLAANSGIVLGGGFGAIGKTTVNADNVCLLQSGSAQLSGGGSYAIY